MIDPRATMLQPGVFAPPYAGRDNLVPLYPKDGVYFGDKIIEQNSKRRLCPEITILSLLSGRWFVFGNYLRNLNLLDYPKSKINLLLFCTSKDIYFRNVIKSLKSYFNKCGYRSVRIEVDESNSPSHLVFSEKSGPVLNHLDGISKAYKSAFSLVETDLCFSIEDDEILPSHSLKKLLIYFSDRDVACASGIARGRHGEGFVAFDFFINPENGEILGKPLDRRKMLNASCVGSSGLGCTLLNMREVRKIDIVHKLDDVSGLSGCDVVMGYQFNRMGKRVIVDWDIYAYHISSVGDIF